MRSRVLLTLSRQKLDGPMALATPEDDEMQWRNRANHPFNRGSVILNAPMQSGVYVLRDQTRWIYVGETNDILARLIQHLDGDNSCIALFRNLTFSYEVLPEVVRGGRLEELIRKFRPICNQWAV
jgi:hypothetical protein